MRKILCFCIGLLMASAGLQAQVINQDITCELSHISALSIEKNPQIQRYRYRIAQARANRQTATSAFDFQLVADANYNRDRLHLFNQDSRFSSTDGRVLTNNYSYSAGLQRTFRSGLSSRLSLEHARIANNYPFNDFGEERPAFLADNFSTVRASVSQPLLRGRGKKYATAFERSAQKLVRQTELDLIFGVTGELLDMTTAYWNYLGNFKRASIFKENEDRVRKVLEITQELVDADRKAKNDLIQIQADLKDKERQSLVANQLLYRSRQNLGRSIGLDEVESTFLSDPVNAFPTLAEANYYEEIDLESLLELAREKRTDLKALITAKESLQIDFERARNDIMPQLDLLGSLSYGGTDVGNGFGQVFTPLSRIPGRNVRFGLGLSFQFPVNNNAAKANFLRNKVLVSDQEVAIDNQIRNIELNISIVLNELHNNVRKLEKAEQALQFYQEVFSDEQIKFQNGLTTLLNLILFQERLTFSQLDYLQAQEDFANSIASLRFETGTLLPIEDNASFSIDREVFFVLPGRE